MSGSGTFIIISLNPYSFNTNERNKQHNKLMAVTVEKSVLYKAEIHILTYWTQKCIEMP